MTSYEVEWSNFPLMEINQFRENYGEEAYMSLKSEHIIEWATIQYVRLDRFLDE